MLHGPSAVPPLGALVPGAVALPEDLLAHLQRHMTPRDVAHGDILLRQGAVTCELVVLVCGTVATLVEFGGVGDLVVETTNQPGRIFGWSGLRPPGRATATLRADSGCRVLTIPLDRVADGPSRWMAALCELVAGSLADRAGDLERSHPDHDGDA